MAREETRRFGRIKAAVGLAIYAATITAAQAQSNAFEVASIRPLKGNIFRAGISIAGDRVTVSGPLKHILTLAYNTKDYLISGGPNWANEDLYEIIAKVGGDGTPTVAQAREMLQALLADRFQLKINRGTKEVPIYALMIGKDGSKLKESEDPAKFSVNSTAGPRSKIVASSVSMAQLSYQIGNLVRDRPVRDKTGLTGHYDVTLEFTPEGTPADVADGPSVFTAVQALGLKLEPTKEIGESLVIDRAERPSEN